MKHSITIHFVLASLIATLAPAHAGISFNGGIVGGKIEVKKGYWCTVRGSGIITFGQSGPTEAKATELAQEKCHSVYKDSKCELVSCKSND